MYLVINNEGLLHKWSLSLESALQNFTFNRVQNCFRLENLKIYVFAKYFVIP